MSGDASEIFALAADLSGVSAKLVRPVREVAKQVGEATAKEWAGIARGTAGKHGKHYPNSIDSELRGFTNIEVEIGPNSAKLQGRMGRGFEFGSVNQPPHMDGAKAMDAMEPRAETMFTEAIDPLIP